MKKKFIIAGNWKMNKTTSESISFIKELNTKLGRIKNNINFENLEILIFPPYTSLFPLKDISSPVSIGAQNIFYEDKGAFTGEISPAMIKEIAGYVLIGHSERRELFGEKDENINKKIKASFNADLIPVLCVGETLSERESGNTFKKIERQLSADLDGITPEQIDKLYIAYEPIWAIGTGKTATPELAQEVHAFIKEKIESITGSQYDRPILYGGSVKPDNCKNLLGEKDINGVLIGGASLKVDSFFDIIENSLELVE